jgi:DNA-directed RNA polymerase specialized sigma24 family protein
VEIRSEEIDPRLDCFRACLDTLPLEHRRLIVDYYREAELSRIEQRKTMADMLQIPLNALRIRAHRLRAQLDRCISNCLRN